MLSSIYYQVRSYYKLNLIVWLSRYLLAFAFIPSGMRKVLNHRFTSIGTEHPIGYFFEALYSTGMYWNFIGWVQILAAALMMTQQFSTLGNLIYVCITTNIFLITISLHFTGTWLIALLMLFASTCLLLWDANKLQYIFSNKGLLKTDDTVNLPEASIIWQISGMILFVLSILYIFIDNIINKSHRILLIYFFVLIMITVFVTIILEIRNHKLKNSHL